MANGRVGDGFIKRGLVWVGSEPDEALARLATSSGISLALCHLPEGLSALFFNALHGPQGGTDVQRLAIAGFGPSPARPFPDGRCIPQLQGCEDSIATKGTSKRRLGRRRNIAPTG